MGAKLFIYRLTKAVRLCIEMNASGQCFLEPIMRTVSLNGSRDPCLLRSDLPEDCLDKFLTRLLFNTLHNILCETREFLLLFITLRQVKIAKLVFFGPFCRLLSTVAWIRTAVCTGWQALVWVCGFHSKAPLPSGCSTPHATSV